MYKFKRDPHQYNFYMATYGSTFGDKKIIFRVREGIDPKVRAKEKGIKWYDRIVPCTYQDYIHMWLDTHKEYELISPRVTETNPSVRVIQ